LDLHFLFLLLSEQKSCSITFLLPPLLFFLLLHELLGFSFLLPLEFSHLLSVCVFFSQPQSFLFFTLFQRLLPLFFNQLFFFYLCLPFLLSLFFLLLLF